MDPGIAGIILLVSVAIVAAAVLHRFVRSFLHASFAASMIASVALITADTIYRGYPDKRAAAALIIGVIVSFIISLPVGWATRRFFRPRQNSDVQK
jgi:hypothetical protein